MRKPSVIPYVVLIVILAIFEIPFALVSHALGVGLAIFNVLVLVLCARGYRKKYKQLGIAQSCPSCKALYAENIVKREEINRKGGYETVTRYDTTSGTISTPGSTTTQNIHSTTLRNEQVHMTYVTYLNYLRCPSCGHQWTKVSTSKFEG